MVPIVRGGLGNQMFVMAAGMVAAKVKECPLYILDPPPMFNKHNRFGLDYNATIFKGIGTKVPQIFLLERYKRHDPPGFAAWNPAALEVGTVLDSYYQYYPALEAYESELRRAFLEGLQPHLDQLPPLPRGGHTTAFMHVRRGDYMNLPGYHFIQPIEYYKSAVERLDTEVAATRSPPIDRIIIDSDDAEWVKSHAFFTSDPRFQIVADESRDELTSLAQMVACRGGAICGNSTFSWWGAFLGAHGERAPVIVPAKKRWIADKIEDLFPRGWIELDVSVKAE
jgi:hypothetical protein